MHSTTKAEAKAEQLAHEEDKSVFAPSGTF